MPDVGAAAPVPAVLAAQAVAAPAAKTQICGQENGSAYSGKGIGSGGIGCVGAKNANTIQAQDATLAQMAYA